MTTPKHRTTTRPPEPADSVRRTGRDKVETVASQRPEFKAQQAAQKKSSEATGSETVAADTTTQASKRGRAAKKED